MTLVTAPNLIEQSDFSGGWNPDQEVVTSPPNTLRDMYNLLPELGGTGALNTRKGFKRIREELDGGLTSHYVVNIHPFRGNGTSYLIVVMVKDEAAANNVRIYAVNMEDLTVARINTAGVTWANPTSPHWGIGIDEIYYGGSRGNNMYSWDPTGPTWDADASTDPNWKTWIDAQDDGVNTATQLGRDFAWTGKEIVTYSGDQYAPSESIRFDTFDSGTDSRYKRGDKVSRKTVWNATSTYWKSFECIKAHVPATEGATSYPGTGATWKTYWKKIRLPAPVNADNETSNKWYFVPVAAQTHVAEWYSGRLWMRYDGMGDKSRVLYSAPVQPEKGEDVPDVVWDPTDFAPGNDLRGPGGGWVPFNDGKKGGVIEALRAYGQYLLVFKRQAVWVLTGASEDSFTVRRLAQGVGAVGASCVTEMDGLVYFLSDDGLYVTDGTAVEPVQGFEKFATTIKERLDLMGQTAVDAMVVDFEDRIWVSLPYASAGAGEKYWTLVYEPRSGGIYKTNLPVGAMHTARHEGVGRLYFSTPDAYGTNNDYVHQYGHANAGDADDTNAGTYASTPITWFATTAWWPFGLLREQRRIRRVWALVKGVMTFTIKAYRDWVTSEETTEDRVVSASTATHIEGEYMRDSHAISLRVSGPSAPATLYGMAVDTQPRRARYHVS
jgi:hypothetical protein